MHIGVDFDNIIVNCEPIFLKIALQKKLIPHDLKPGKRMVRDYLRSVGKETDWTALQGEVYGGLLQEAETFPGAIEFFKKAKSGGIRLSIISHKTKKSVLGPAYDLHQAARNWLVKKKFLRKDLVTEADVFFETSWDDKLKRIGREKCTHFIDDLLEFLTQSNFPLVTEKILFDPSHQYETDAVRSARSWDELAKWLLH